MIVRALVALLAVLALALTARAQELAIPKNDGWVTDAAGSRRISVLGVRARAPARCGAAPSTGPGGGR